MQGRITKPITTSLMSQKDPIMSCQLVIITSVYLMLERMCSTTTTKKHSLQLTWIKMPGLLLSVQNIVKIMVGGGSKTVLKSI